MDQDNLSPNKKPTDRLVDRTLEALQEEYVVVGKTHIRAWHTWLFLGLVAGIVFGVSFVANRSGEFEASQAAFSNDRFFGAHISYKNLNNEQYIDAVNKYFNQVSIHMDWGYDEKSQGQYNWDKRDALVAFAEENNLPILAHAPLYQPLLPKWVKDLPTVAQRRAAADKWLTALVTRYKGKIWGYTVVNEPIYHPMQDLFGSGYIKHFHEIIRSIDPQAKLLLSEFSVAYSGTKSDTYYNRAKNIYTKRPDLLDGIAFEGHFLENKSVADISSVIDRFSNLGLPLYITEFDAKIANDDAQRTMTRELFTMLGSKPAVKGITHWGFWAGSAWRGADAAILRLDFSERLSAQWLRKKFISGFLGQ